MGNTQKSIINRKFFLIAAFGHLLCWIGGDLLLFFQPNGFLDVQGLFDYEKTVLMYDDNEKIIKEFHDFHSRRRRRMGMNENYSLLHHHLHDKMSPYHQE